MTARRDAGWRRCLKIIPFGWKSWFVDFRLGVLYLDKGRRDGLFFCAIRPSKLKEIASAELSRFQGKIQIWSTYALLRMSWRYELSYSKFLSWKIVVNKTNHRPLFSRYLFVLITWYQKCLHEFCWVLFWSMRLPHNRIAGRSAAGPY